MKDKTDIGYYLVTDIQHLPPVIRLYPYLGGIIFTCNKKIFNYLQEKYQDLNIKAYLCKNTREIHKLILKNRIRIMIYPSYHVLFLGKAIQIFHGGLSDKNYVESVKVIVYDLVLFPGEKTKDKVARSGYLKYLREWKIIGYPKFDPLVNMQLEVKQLFNNKRKTILYAPTWVSQKTRLKMIKFSPYGESSLELWAKPIIRALQQNYNLIIKYHSRIYRKPDDIYDQVEGLIAELDAAERVKVVVDDNILSYMYQADLMISDISTACYEWFHFNRPIIFANPAPEHYQVSEDISSNTYAWQCGDVINKSEDILPLVERNLENDIHQGIRNKIFNYTVFQPDGKATARQVTEILDFAAKYKNTPYLWLIFTSYLFRRYRRNLSKIKNWYYHRFRKNKIGK
ncbi:MAG: CDP-glycerol glycerophosphotransferase family protein [Candidatus Cloacimonetes bacterium]|nr:CDP-glycerol glycerophosphotransferase family protein [Candidatus Cloacimonadota bacterium]